MAALLPFPSTRRPAGRDCRRDPQGRADLARRVPQAAL